ncbi:MAG: hypothetical protein M3243_01670 [Thermoproteota archaeon]|nr:hypothetical protein [Thermoproteota archaeon]MDQ5842223.1 hypothetical protein [Thermoproteota archaeon]
MPKRNFSTLEEFKAHIHTEGASLVDFSGVKVPCILIKSEKYQQILHNVYEKKVRADTLLDIFYDGENVFVDIQVKLLDTGFEENFLLYVNDMIEFFEALAESGMLSFAPDSLDRLNSQNLFVIQLPKKDAAEQALEIIKANLKRQS